MSRTIVELGRTALSDNVTLVSQEITSIYSHRDTPYVYQTYDLEGLSDHAVVALSELAAILKTAEDDAIIDYLKDYARDLAEDAELPFTFEDADGDTQTYTPASLWESSGGCEWETSAQEGYDYGWNI
uniref:Uncharacterized protein n=2 Tax=unclassified bacterial viruses TaxID=12333 RepID=A0AAU6VZM0_9VIRU